MKTAFSPPNRVYSRFINYTEHATETTTSTMYRAFYYVPVRKNQLTSIAQNGLRVHAPLSDDPDFIRAHKTVLVLPKTAWQEGQTHLPPTAFLNLEPYLPAKHVVAAGGYLVRESANGREILVMYRRGRWDLPKGKQDKGETDEETAIREVCEEIGIESVQIVTPLGNTQHTYANTFKPRFDVKTTFWYLMTTTATEFTPQAEEDIEALQWIPVAALPEKLGFETLADHARAWLDAVATTALVSINV